MTNHLRGALIGLAVGDALGAAVEFKSPASFAPVTGYRSGGPHHLEAGEWTDDTSMALALADSIATAGWNLNDQADRYVEWWKTGKYSVNGRCFDIGITTRSALGNYAADKDALASGDRSDRASGNGSIMRLAPVPIRYADLFPHKVEEISRFAEESSLPTHASDQCVSACRYLATVLAALIHGEDRDEVLSPDWQPLQQLNAIKTLHPLIREIAQGSFRQKQPPAIQGSGWVVKSLETSLWAFHDADTFEKAVLRAVNLGDDADGRREIFPDLVLGIFPGEDARHVHDPGQDGPLLQDVPHGPEAALPEDQFEPVSHADGLEQPLLANALGKTGKVAHVLAVATAHVDVGDLEFFQHGSLPPLASAIKIRYKNGDVERACGWRRNEFDRRCNFRPDLSLVAAQQHEGRDRTGRGLARSCHEGIRGGNGRHANRTLHRLDADQAKGRQDRSRLGVQGRLRSGCNRQQHVHDGMAPKSGRQMEFPEMDRADFFDVRSRLHRWRWFRSASRSYWASLQGANDGPIHFSGGTASGLSPAVF
jgi:ADP-ribosyl-[dinitrogen reductase] hydrolase